MKPLIQRQTDPTYRSLLRTGCVFLLAAMVSRAVADSPEWRTLAPPMVDGQWLRPADDRPAQPIWGHADGIRVGLHPMPGPRGLLRIYAPYLGHREGRVINFIAVEPIVRGETDRGLSELEYSRLDQTPGKRFWSANKLDDLAPRLAERAASGWVERIDGVECLRVLILVEPFDNGAHVYLRLSFRADRPHEVGIASFAHADSQPLSHCIVTATMGNYARLRELQLAERSVPAADLWPDYRGHHFTPHARFALEELARTPEGHAVATATPNEQNPQDAKYAFGTRRHWRYEGELATQSWRSVDPDPRLAVQVNGRHVYWNSIAPIPGGVSYENFEMVAPFKQGQEFWFGVRPDGEPRGGEARVHD